MPLEKLKVLRNDMIANEKAVIVFRFTYNQIVYLPYFSIYVIMCSLEQNRSHFFMFGGILHDL